MVDREGSTTLLLPRMVPKSRVRTCGMLEKGESAKIRSVFVARVRLKIERPTSLWFSNRLSKGRQDSNVMGYNIACLSGSLSILGYRVLTAEDFLTRNDSVRRANGFKLLQFFQKFSKSITRESAKVGADCKTHTFSVLPPSPL